MSEETVEAPIDLDDALETGGLFFVTQILPVVAEEDLKPPTDDADVEGEEEQPRPEPIEEDLCTYQLEPTVIVKPPKDRVHRAANLGGTLPRQGLCLFGNERDHLQDIV
ncbi:uncharacterized protein CEXT_235861 [Caerostris extrusa]|uniref:Uncharacterized protein n=1 Tax=Caerostris extrusa TaxID=172846 RepID=A0AAV4N4H8_CAEEX|nr:uncharacterized protein CEXT_235861 [Caerostris extrusa]